MLKRKFAVLAAIVTALVIPDAAKAVTIVGGSSLLNDSYATQLESWLGEGSIEITNIFARTVGDGQTSVDFHAAADGMGRTFSVIEVLATQGNEHQVIGGYNPVSWSSKGDYNYTYPTSERTAFIYNLTNADLRRQAIDDITGYGPAGVYQTYNSQYYGPTFGGGHDIFTNGAFDSGYVYSFSYGVPYTTSLLGAAGYTSYYRSFEIGTVEVFTIAGASANTAPVPEPGTLLLLGSGIAGLALARRKFKAKG